MDARMNVRPVVAVVAVLCAGIVALGASPAAAAPCIGSGAAECPYDGVTRLDERPDRSPYSPASVVVNHTTHDIYIADRFDNAVKQYSQDGTFIRKWGGSDFFAIDDVDQPVGVTLDAAGDVWVAVLNGNRIAEFDADGDILSTLGAGQGPGDGQFFFPEDAAIAPNGHVWVADTGNNRVQEFAADGTFLAKYGSTDPPGMFGGLPAGTGLGEFDRPLGITVAPNGDVYVADTDNNRLQRLPAGTTAWEAIGAVGGGSGPGDFLQPNDVIAEPDGSVYATQSGRTQKRSAVGVWTDVSGTEGGDDIDVEDGKVFLVQTSERRLRVLNEADGTPFALTNPIEPAVEELRGPQATAVDAAGNLFVADTDANRIVKLNAVTGAFIAAFGSSGSGDGELNGPWGVAVDTDGHVLVADSSNNRIQKLDSTTGAFIAGWGTQGQGAGELDLPFGVAVAADGSLIVADTGNNRVQRSNAARDAWTVIGGRDDEQTGSAVGEFYFPSDVAVTAAGDVWASDPGNDRVQKLPTGSGTWQAFGSTGSGDGQFNYPRGIDVSADGSKVFVADTNGNRVQRLSGAGIFEAKWGQSGYGDDACPGEFGSPWGIAVAPDGAVLVSDNIDGHVTRFTFGSGSIPACDHTAPSVALQSPVDNATAVAASPTFTVTGGIGAGDDAAMTVRVMQVSGAATFVVRTLTSTDRTDTTWTVAWSGDPLPDGEYLWEAVQGDASGNEGVSLSRSFRVGAIPLAITHLNAGLPVSGASPGANPVTDDQTPTFSGTAPNGGGDPTTITVHLDRYNGTSFDADVHTFTTARDPGGNWSVTAPVALQPETWQVRVSQGVQESAPWWFQLQALSISQITEGTPVSGNPPGPNPVIFDTTPTFAGLAFSGAGASNTVTVHLDRWNGSTWIADVHTFDTTRNANGIWSATAPAIIPETWQVRVTQVVDSVTRESAAWWFQVQASPPLAISELNADLPVSGSPPGANPVLFDSTPTFKGTAGLLPGDSSTVTIHLDRNSSSGFVDDVHTFTATRDGSGNWTATAPALVPETWRVRVTQDAASSASWFFQLKASPPLAISELNAGLPVSGSPPGANPVLFDTTPSFKGTAGLAPGDASTVTIHLDRNSSSGFVDDAHTFDATVDGDGNWSATAPALVPETWRVRVTQGAASSDGWFFQLKFNPPLAVTHLSTGLPVSGSPPGPNPNIGNLRPTFHGTASLTPDLPEIVVVRLHRWNGSSFERDVIDLLVERDGNTGAWSATPEGSLGYESYAVQVSQGTESSAEWFFHNASPPPPNNAPTITVREPRSGGVYIHGNSYRSDFSCDDDDATAPSCDAPSTIDTASVGSRSFTVRSRDSRGLTSEKSVAYTVAPRPATEGIDVRGLEITQATQTAGLESAESTLKVPGIPFTTRSAKYNGVHLVSGREAFVRVYLEASRGHKVFLSVYRPATKRLETYTPETLNQKIDTSAADLFSKQRNPFGGYVFRVPGSVFSGTLSLIATAVPDHYASLDACSDCGQANGFAITDVVPRVTRGFRLNFVHLKNGKKDSASVDALVERTLQTLPVRRDKVELPDVWDTTLNVSDLDFKPKDDRGELALIRMGRWNDEQGDNLGGITIGVAQANWELGISDGETIFAAKTCSGGILGIGQTCEWNRPDIAVSFDDRPLTGTGHEIGHALGREHASKACKGGTGGQIGEPWKPDQKGYLNGIGWDWDALSSGTPRIIDPSRNANKPVWDYMSYCADPLGQQDPSSWISPKGWESVFARLLSSGSISPVAGISSAGQSADGHVHDAAQRWRNGPKASVAQAGGQTMDVRAVLHSNGKVEFTSAEPGNGPVGTQGAPFALVARGANGEPTGIIPMTSAVSHANQGGSFALLRAGAPKAGTESLDIVGAGGVLATKKRSPNAPKVTVPKPKVRRSSIVVSWTASDADKDPVEATVEWSADGGRTFEVVFRGPSTGSESFPLERFERTNKGVVRVTANDGWNEAVASSPKFTAPGAPPAVRILSPQAGLRTSNDQVLTLSGSATDDRGKALGASALKWFAGSKYLGSGTQISASGLKPGRAQIRLEARDRFGRRASAKVTIRLRAAKPAFTKLVAPASLKPTARTVRLKVATSLPSKLKAGGRRYSVGSKAKSITVKVKPGKTDLRLKLELSAYGKNATETLTIKR